MKFSICTLIFATYMGNAMPNISYNIKFIVNVAEFFKIKFLDIFPLENVDNALQPLLNLQFYFSICRMKNLEAMKFPPFKTMAVYIPDQEKRCSDIDQISKHPHVIWLVIINTDYDLDLNNTYLPFNSQFLVAQFDSSKNHAVIREMYQFNPKSRIYSQMLGYWEYENGFNLTEATFFERRSNFYDESVLIVPFRFIRAGAAGENVPDFIPSTWDAISRRINATSKVTNNESVFDLLVNFYLPTETQELPVMKKVISVLFYKEDSTDFNATRFLDPFTFQIWLSILSWIILSSLGMLMIDWSLSLTKENYSFFLLDAFYIILQQGTQIAENVLSFFTIKTSQLALSLFLFICYGSVLISFLTVSEHQAPFSDLEGILQDGRYNILAQPKKGYDAFKYGRPGVVRDLFIKQVTPLERQPKTFQESFTILCEGKQKVLVECALEHGPIIVDSSANPCKIKHVRFTILKMGFQMPPKNPFREIITVCVTKLLESEAVGQIFWKKGLPPIKFTVQESFSSITIEQTSTLFIIFVLGVILSASELMLEILWHKSRERKAKNNYH